MLRECIQCGREFQSLTTGRPRSTCSRWCWRARHRHLVAVSCGRPEKDLGGSLPVAPLLPWLAGAVEKAGSIRVLAQHLEMNEALLQKWLTGVRQVTSVDTVDRMFCMANEPCLLRELYPYLYDLEEVA